MSSNVIDRRALLAWLATLSACGGGGGQQAVAEGEPGPIIAMDVGFSDVRHGWAVGKGGVILATSDGGVHWRGQSSGVVDDVHEISPVNALHAWALPRSGKILRTQDGGQTWSVLVADDRAHDFSDIWSPPDSTRVLVRSIQVHGFNNATMRATTNGGASWYTPMFQDYDTVVSQSGVLMQQDISSRYRPVQLSTDFGKTSRELPLLALRRGVLEDDSLWLQITTDPSIDLLSSVRGLALARSVDGGRSWSQAVMNIPSEIGSSKLAVFEIELLSVSGGGWATVSVGNGTAGFLHSTDLGRTWLPVDLPGGLSFAQIVSTAIDGETRLLQAYGLNNAWLTVDGGKRWSPMVVAGETDMVVLCRRDQGHGLLAAFRNGSGDEFRWYRSTDQGGRWTRL